MGTLLSLLMPLCIVIPARNEATRLGAGLAVLAESLRAQGLTDTQVIVSDNGSTDDTAEIARRYLGHGLVGMESLKRPEYFSLQRVLTRKQELAATLDADWFIHHDADEIRTGAKPGQTLAAALAGEWIDVLVTDAESANMLLSGQAAAKQVRG